CPARIGCIAAVHRPRRRRAVPACPARRRAQRRAAPSARARAAWRSAWCGYALSVLRWIGCQISTMRATTAQARQASPKSMMGSRAYGPADDSAPKRGVTSCVATSIARADRQFLGREQRDDLAALVGHDDFLLDARCGIAVGCRTIGLER